MHCLFGSGLSGQSEGEGWESCMQVRRYLTSLPSVMAPNTIFGAVLARVEVGMG